MASDYREHLSAASLRLLAEATGFSVEGDPSRAFQSRPHDIKVALGSPKAVRLLDLTDRNPLQHRLLQLAVAVHRTAQDICQAGWIATDESVIDLNMLTYSGQSQHQQFVVGLLASYLPSPAPVEFEMTEPHTLPCSEARLRSLIELCTTSSDTERAGALRLLGDEALFTVGMFPAVAHHTRIDHALLEELEAVLPRAVISLMDELEPELHTLLDVYLLFGPVWYRMASQNLLFNGEREALSTIATDFATARRFIVQVAQGPLAAIKHDLYPGVA